MTILVCCHSQQQLAVFVYHTGAHVHQVRSPRDLLGVHQDTVLYLLPKWAWAYSPHRFAALFKAVVAWRTTLGRRCVNMPEAVVLGEAKMEFPARIKESVP